MQNIPQLQQTGTPQDCPVVALFNSRGQLLVGLRHYTPDKWKTVSVWTIPGGRSERDDALENALRRETAEEVGITEFKITGFLGTVPGSKEGDMCHVFTGTTDKEPTLMEPEKFSEWKWVDLATLPPDFPFINPQMLELIKNYHAKRFSNLAS